MVNVQLLKDAIKESGMTTSALCKKSGMSRQLLYKRYKKPNFTVEEVLGLRKALRLTQGETNKIFFANDVE